LRDRLWDRGNLIAIGPKLFQIGQLRDRLWDRGNLIVTEVSWKPILHHSLRYDLSCDAG
jgi:hypothetical protein